MAYRIIGDSCCDFTKTDRMKHDIVSVPMSVIIGGVEYQDDGQRTQEEWISLMKNDEGYPKSACPSPDAFFRAFDAEKDNFVVTLSSKLSGVYNSAMVAKEMFLEEFENARIHVFDSLSAAAGQHLIFDKITEALEQGLSFEKVVEKVEAFRDDMRTIFVLDDLETFKKNGRLRGVKALVATTMNIKPVLVGDEGEVRQIDQGIGMHRAVNKMLQHIEKMGLDKNRKVRITQCDSKELCTRVARILKERFGFEDIKILNAGGLSTIYENPGGIVMAL
ncbi:MAG: DegV family protein [Lachnospiraceae bacterium]|nr:DegV family protein [Lachnospiraceae bacterium]